MQWVRRAWGALGHVSTAAWAWGLGGSVLVTPFVGWLLASQTNMPRGWLLLAAAGTLILALLIIITGITHIIEPKLRQRPADSVAPASDLASDSPKFDPYRYLVCKLMRVSFDRLWDSVSPFIDFHVYARDASGSGVELTGISGSAVIDGSECTFEARLASKAHTLGDPVGFQDVTITQPITPDMARHIADRLANDDSKLTVGLSQMHWIGTVGGRPLPKERVVVDNDDSNFRILGPVKEEHKDKVLFKAAAIVVSQESRSHDDAQLKALLRADDHRAARLELDMAEKQGRIFELEAKVEELSKPLAPRPIIPMNPELVIAIKTYGFPACDRLTDLLEDVWSSLRQEEGLVKFLPSVFNEGAGSSIAKAVSRLRDRLEAGESHDPLLPIWAEFHAAYCTGLILWVARLGHFLGFNQAQRDRIERWQPVHDKYYERVRELGNAPDGSDMKDAFDRCDDSTQNYLAGIHKAVSAAVDSPAADKEGPPR